MVLLPLPRLRSLPRGSRAPTLVPRLHMVWGSAARSAFLPLPWARLISWGWFCLFLSFLYSVLDFGVSERAPARRTRTHFISVPRCGWIVWQGIELQVPSHCPQSFEDVTPCNIYGVGSGGACLFFSARFWNLLFVLGNLKKHRGNCVGLLFFNHFALHLDMVQRSIFLQF